MKQLSIITINYNNKSGLQKTIDSVIQQTYTQYEWIIIDGDSTDGSKRLLTKYSNYFSHCISEKDKGIYDAMNKGIKIASGKYLLFLNSGDYLYENTTLEKVFSKNYDVDYINGNIVKVLNNKIVEYDYGIHSENITCFDLLKFGLNHQSTFINKKLFDKYGLYDDKLKLISDWKFFFHTMIFGQCSLKYINLNIAFFDISGRSNNKGNLSLHRKEKEEYLNSVLPSKIIEDYKFTLCYNEVRKYKLSRILFSLLYRIVIIYEKIKFKHN